MNVEEVNNGKISQKEFTEQLAKQLEEAVTRDYGLPVTADPKEILKNNGMERQGITVNFAGSRVAPTVYTEDAYRDYQNGMSVREIADRMSETVYKAYQEMPEMPELTPEAAKKAITLTLVNTKQNEERLRNIPHFTVADGELAAVPRYYLNPEASFIVTNETCGMMQLTPDEVLKIGQDNINAQHFEVKSMREILAGYMGEEMADMMQPSDMPDFLVLSSADRLQGSKALLSEEALNEVHEKLGDYMVIPSSIHEVLCLPISDDMEPDTFRNMVREVNGSQVAPEERLSDNIMKYDGHKLSLVGESFTVDAPKVKEPKLDTEKFKMSM